MKCHVKFCFCFLYWTMGKEGMKKTVNSNHKPEIADQKSKDVWPAVLFCFVLFCFVLFCRVFAPLRFGFNFFWFVDAAIQLAIQLRQQSSNQKYGVWNKIGDSGTKPVILKYCRCTIYCSTSQQRERQRSRNDEYLAGTRPLEKKIARKLRISHRVNGGGVGAHGQLTQGANWSKSQNQIQTLKECLCCHIYCAHLETPWHRTVTAFRAVSDVNVRSQNEETSNLKNVEK